MNPSASPVALSAGALKRILILAGACLLTACATTVISPELESEAGAAMSQQVVSQIGLYQDEALGNYVSAVGERLVAALGESPYQFRFSVLDQFEPNAFAAPGGYIYISRGLLAQLNSEAELAGVLAHEISHVTRRHHARQVGRAVGAGLLTLPGRAVGVVSEDLGKMINSPIEHAGQVYLSSYSRGQESDADAHGMRLAASAGYPPLALADALAGIERSTFLLTGEVHEASYLDTHPTTPERVADIQRLAAGLAPSEVAPLANREQLYARLDGIWWGPQNPQQGIFRDNVFLNADMDFAVNFPAGWETANTPRFAGAMEPEGGAYLALGGNSGEFSPEGYAAALISRMRDRAGLSPALSQATRVGDWPAHLVRYDDDSGAETVSLYYLFLASPRASFTFMAMGLQHYAPAMREAVLSMRPLSDAEEDSIDSLRLRTAPIRQGESLEAWGERLDSQWPPAFIASMNGLADQHYTGGGETLKYVRRESYQAH